MSAYISTDLNMVKELDPRRHELALLQDEFLSKGGTIQELIPFQYVPPPIRHEPPTKKKVSRAKPAPKPEKQNHYDKMAQRDIEREERIARRAKDKADLIERVRKLAVNMTQAEAMALTGMDRRKLHSIAKENGFSFKKSSYVPTANLRRCVADESQDAKNAERIKAFKEIGLTRNQATEKLGITYRAFSRIIEKFGIDYPATGRRGTRHAFSPKTPKQSD